MWKVASLFSAWLILTAASLNAQDAKPLPKTPEQFKYSLGLKLPPKPALRAMAGKLWVLNGRKIERLPTATAEKYDCREFGWLGPVKNQGSCGSCWDFSGTCGVESANIRAGVFKAGELDLSEQYTLDCYQNGGCGGDWMETPLKHAKEVGIPSTKDYGPYQAREGNCKDTSKFTLYKIKDYGFVSRDGEVPPVQDIKNAIVAYGPLPVAVAVTGGQWNNPGSDVITGSGTGVNHAVILCGWDDSKKAWIMRNSWGQDWGMGGYCWIGYGADSIGYAAMWCDAGAGPNPPPPPPPPPPPANYDVLMDIAGMTVVAPKGWQWGRSGGKDVKVTPGRKIVLVPKGWKVQGPQKLEEVK